MALEMYSPEFYHAEIEGHQWHVLGKVQAYLRNGFEYLVFDKRTQTAFVGVLDRGTARSNEEWYWRGEDCEELHPEQLVCFIPTIPQELNPD
jgi:hypothetical protein